MKYSLSLSLRLHSQLTVSSKHRHYISNGDFPIIMLETTATLTVCL